MQRLILGILCGIIAQLSLAASSLELARQAENAGNWQQVIKLLTNDSDIESLLLRGEAWRNLGFIDQAQAAHEQAWQLVNNTEQAVANQTAISEQATVNEETVKTDSVKNTVALTSALTLLEQRQYAAVAERINYLTQNQAQLSAEELARLSMLNARLSMAQGNQELARAAYLAAKAQANRVSLKTREANLVDKVEANRAGVKVLNLQARLGIINTSSVIPTAQEIDDLVAAINELPAGYVQAALILGITERLTQIPQYLPLAAILIEKKLPDLTEGQQKAEYFSLRAAILEKTGRTKEALVQATAAINEASRINTGEVLMREEWRRGRLYQQLGDEERALSSLKRAVFHLSNIRGDIPVEYQDGRSLFRETDGKLYLQLADMLLKKAARYSEQEAQPILLEARDVIEQFKAAELEDYMGGSCRFDLKPITNLETIAPRTGVLYPIMLNERLELLLGIGERQFRVTVPVKAAQIEQVSKEFAENLRYPDDKLVTLRRLANQLYAWIIAPIKAQLSAHHVETLVIVPDGALRLFPVSALMDNDQFLIEQYTVVTAPGLALIDPQPFAKVGVQALIAGMSYPGAVIDEIPIDLLFESLKDIKDIKDITVLNKLLNEEFKNPDEHEKIKELLIGINNSEALNKALKNPDESEKIKKLLTRTLALSNVNKEVKEIASLLQTQPLLNEDFTLANFSQQFDRSLRVVHVASHGYFGGSPDNSFFMTYDHLVMMNQLENILRGTGKNEASLELLTLSACQTAEGNDRAPLGITGVAIKSGARSVLGSLWPVSDDATQMLLSEFYRQLSIPQQTKAKAFQAAQLAVLRDERFKHPYFWSPFILVGNWL